MPLAFFGYTHTSSENHVDKMFIPYPKMQEIIGVFRLTWSWSQCLTSIYPKLSTKPGFITKKNI
tara:strand:+ start:14443 stop:14634 length:192 start_codon:yes stop_codon:yes gene_type:complete